MGNSSSKKEKKLRIDVNKLNILLNSLPDAHFKCSFEVELIQRDFTPKYGLCCSRSVSEFHFGFKIIKIYQIKQLRQQIILQESDFQDLSIYFADLIQCPTPGGEDSIMEDYGKCDICFVTDQEQMLPCGHSFCKGCVEKWFIQGRKRSCPKCRRDTESTLLFSQPIPPKLRPEVICQKIRALLNSAYYNQFA